MQPDFIAQGLKVKDHVGRAVNVVMRACATPLCLSVLKMLATGASDSSTVETPDSTSAHKASPGDFDAEWEAFKLKVQAELVRARKLHQVHSY